MRVRVGRVVVGLFVAAVCACGAEMVGFISDAACGWNNARNTKEAKECAQKCVKAGWDPVFVRDNDYNAYKVSDKAKVMAYVGERVAVTGKLGKDSVTIEKIRKVQ